MAITTRSSPSSPSSPSRPEPFTTYEPVEYDLSSMPPCPWDGIEEPEPCDWTASAADVGKKKRKRSRRPPPAYDPKSPFPQSVKAPVVAAALGCSPQHVYAMAAAGRLPHSRHDGRVQFPVEGIRDYLRDHKVA